MKLQTKASQTKHKEVHVKFSSPSEYQLFDQIDGDHSFKSAVPEGYIEYSVRSRPGGRVFYFNFKLAKEMGLISSQHPDALTPLLQEKILQTFSLVIINEYDLIHQRQFPQKDIRPKKYMATRYLQLQHPNKKGKTSGDGRGIWNGEIKHRGTVWDIASSGTGATQLSPAYAQTKKFIKTGDPNVCYGNGYNALSDGLSATLMSDIFHQRGIETERVLALISFEDGSAIHVRASKNLLRPAHLFHHLKQGNYPALKCAVDYFIDRQIANGDYPNFGPQGSKKRYQLFAERMADTFAKTTSRFESDYIFCWLDWDGDNILCNGGIIDYGSIRQFGLYHKEYRYDDVSRFSTNIPEQKAKARYIVQTIAQLRDFLITGKKRTIGRFKQDPLLKLFDVTFNETLQHHLLIKLGLSVEQTGYLQRAAPKLIKKFKKNHAYFEEAQSYRGIYKTADGITADAIFSMSQLCTELPKRFLGQTAGKIDPLKAEELIEIMRSSYARPKDLRTNGYRKRICRQLQKRYLKIVQRVADQFHQGDVRKTLLQMTMRTSVLYGKNNITGDGVLHVTSSIIRNKSKLNFDQVMQVIQNITHHLVHHSALPLPPRSKAKAIVERNLKAVRLYREGL